MVVEGKLKAVLTSEEFSSPEKAKPVCNLQNIHTVHENCNNDEVNDYNNNDNNDEDHPHHHHPQPIILLIPLEHDVLCSCMYSRGLCDLTHLTSTLTLYA